MNQATSTPLAEASEESDRQITVLGAHELTDYIPHRRKSLVLDRLTVNHEAKSGIGIFALHGPRADHCMEDHPWGFPGHWAFEVAAVTAAGVIAVIRNIKMTPETGIMLVGLDGARWRSRAMPGDTLYCAVSVKAFKREVAFFDIRMTDGHDNVVFEADKLVGMVKQA